MNAHKVIIATLIMSCYFINAWADEKIGIGPMVGEPAGISLKKWFNHEEAMDAGIAWSFTDNAGFQIHADYLIHRYGVLPSEDVETNNTPVYFGIGGRVKLKEGKGGFGQDDNNDAIGIRFPLGFTYMYSETPIDVFVEFVPIMDIFPQTEAAINVAIGAHYYF